MNGRESVRRRDDALHGVHVNSAIDKGTLNTRFVERFLFLVKFERAPTMQRSSDIFQFLNGRLRMDPSSLSALPIYLTL